MKTWVLVVSLLVTNLIAQEGMAAAANPTPFPTVTAPPRPTPIPTMTAIPSFGGTSGAVRGETFQVNPGVVVTAVPTATPPRIIFNGAIKGDQVLPVESGVCCFSKTVISPTFDTNTASAARTANTGTVALSPKVECENRNGTWYANKSICPTPTPAATSAAVSGDGSVVGFCCYPRVSTPVTVAQLLDGVAATARSAASPQLICEKNGGTWKTSGNCNVVLYPTDPFPPGDNGLCCNKAPSRGGLPYDAAQVPADTTRQANMSAKDRCLMDPSKEWLVNVSMCPRYANPSTPENGVCCSPLRRVVPGIVNAINCQGENVWKANTTSCGRIVGDMVPLPVGTVKPNLPAQGNNQVDPGSNEQPPCANYKVIDQNFTIGMCMDARGKFATFRNAQVCCIGQ